MRLEALLAILLALSLGGKLAASGATPEVDPAETAQAIERMLAREGFDARVVETRRAPQAYAVAARGACRLIAGEYAPHSTTRDVYRRLAAPLGRLQFAHRGTLHHDEPKLLGLLDYYRWRELRRVSIAAARRPIIAVAASPGCDARRLPWQDLAELPS